MYRIVLTAVLCLLVAGCGWTLTEDAEVTVTFPTKTGDWRDNPAMVGPNAWNLVWKSDIVKDDSINQIVSLNGGKSAVFDSLVDDTCTFLVEAGHGLEVDDIVDAHWQEEFGIEPDPLVTFGLVVTAVDGTTVECSKANAYGGMYPTGWPCRLPKTSLWNITDFQGRDITQARFFSNGGRMAIRPLKAGDVPTGYFVVYDLITTTGQEREWFWAWSVGVKPPWGDNTIYKMRVSSNVDDQLGMQLVRGGPRYRVFRNGVCVRDNSRINWMEFGLVPGEEAEIHVFDQSYLGPDPQPNPRAYLSWDPADSGPDVEYYRIERYVDGAWVTIGQVPYTPTRGRYQYETPALPGSASPVEFRITAVGANEATPVEATITMQRSPASPQATTEFSDTTKTFTLTEVS